MNIKKLRSSLYNAAGSNKNYRRNKKALKRFNKIIKNLELLRDNEELSNESYRKIISIIRDEI